MITKNLNLKRMDLGRLLSSVDDITRGLSEDELQLLVRDLNANSYNNQLDQTQFPTVLERRLLTDTLVSEI